jgi:hypothetical protein
VPVHLIEGRAHPIWRQKVVLKGLHPV